MNSNQENKVESLIKQLTLDEKVDLLGGYENYYTKPIPRLNIPSFRMADGPLGISDMLPSTAYAGGIALAATWNRELAERVGAAIANDARTKDVRFLLAPGVNIYRSPLNGRNFEYYGEDPYSDWISTYDTLGSVQGGLDLEMPKAVFFEKELKGFEKVELQVNQSKTITVILDSRSFAYYDVDSKSWNVPHGTYEILVGNSSQDIRLCGNISI